MRLTDNTGDLEDIDLINTDYSDDDETIYFSTKELIDHMLRIEEQNLFNINLVNDADDQLEKLKAASAKKIQEMKQDLLYKEENIANLKRNKEELEIKRASK